VIKELLLNGKTNDFSHIPAAVPGWIGWHMNKNIMPIVQDIMTQAGGQHQVEMCEFDRWALAIDKRGIMWLYPEKTTVFLRDDAGHNWQIFFTLTWDGSGWKRVVSCSHYDP
jgi:hypothetical protein